MFTNYEMESGTHDCPLCQSIRQGTIAAPRLRQSWRRKARAGWLQRLQRLIRIYQIW